MYALFGYCHYYPSGGWSDFILASESVDDAKAAAVPDDNVYYEVVDLRVPAVVWEGVPYNAAGSLWEPKTHIRWERPAS